jgi:hypothetical protein
MEKQRIFGRKGLTPECCYELHKICERWYPLLFEHGELLDGL